MIQQPTTVRSGQEGRHRESHAPLGDDDEGHRAASARGGGWDSEPDCVVQEAMGCNRQWLKCVIEKKEFYDHSEMVQNGDNNNVIENLGSRLVPWLSA